MDITLDPGGRHSPKYTRAVAAAIPEAVRVLNHATIDRPGDALGYPSTVDAVIRDLGTMAQRLPQLFDQLREWLADEYAGGRIEGSWSAADARASLAVASGRLRDAAAIATRLQVPLQAAAAATGTLSTPYSEDEEG